jgi:hypothetical protein
MYKKKDPGNRDSFVLLSNFLNSSCIQSSRMQPTHKNRKLCRSLKKNLCELCGILTGKIFKIYFCNAFSTENYYRKHSTSAKFFSHLVQELQDSRQAFPPTIYVVALSKIHPILQCRSGFPRETRHGSDTRRLRKYRIHAGIRRGNYGRARKQALHHFSPTPAHLSNDRQSSET